MEWQLLAGIGVLLLFVLIFSGLWVGFALATVGIILLLLFNPYLLNALAIICWNTADSFIITAMPLFIFMGAIILEAGISTQFYRGVSAWFDYIPGSLAHSNILACSLFAAISGSSLATAAAIGTVAIPEMLNRGYDRRLTYGSVAAGGTLGILIPPSILMIIYGAMVSESIGQLFLAGFIPGFMMAAIFILYIALRSIINPRLVPRLEERVNWKARLSGSKHILPILALMLLILGSIYMGVATPTEAAGLGASGALILALAYGRLNRHTLRKSLLYTLRTNSMILLMVIGGSILSFALVSADIPRNLAMLLSALPIPPVGLYCIICAMYLVLGCLISPLPMMILTLPVIFPVTVGLGWDTVWFGVVLVMLLEIGQITPPVGVNLFVVQGLHKGHPFNDIALGSLPYVLLFLIGLALLWVFPDIALWLPSQMFG